MQRPTVLTDDQPARQYKGEGVDSRNLLLRVNLLKLDVPNQLHAVNHPLELMPRHLQRLEEAFVHLFQLGREPDGPQVVADDDHVHQVDEHEDGVPQECVEGAQNHPPPQAEEHAADGEGDA